MRQRLSEISGIRIGHHFRIGMLIISGTICNGFERRATPQGAVSDASAIKAAAPNPAQDQDRRTVFTVSGRVSDPNNHPLANVNISLYRIEPDQVPVPVAETKSDAEGLYRITDIPSLADKTSKVERYHAIVANSPKFESIYERVIESDRVVFDVRMQFAVKIKGRVVDPDGKPVKGVLIWDDRFRDGTLRQQPISTIMNDTTDADGRFTINDLALSAGENNRNRKGMNPEIGASRIRLVVNHPDFADQLAWLPHVPGHGDVKLTYAATIRGKVLDHSTGQPSANVTVTIQPTKQSSVGILDCQSSRTAQTNANGVYQFQGLMPADYNIWATSGDRTCAALNSVPIVAREICQAADLQLVEGGWIEGRIVTLQGQPVSRDSQTGDRLKIGLNGPSRPKTGVSFESFDIDDEGRFRVRVPAGRNFPFLLSRNVWNQTWRAERFERGIDVASGKTVSVKFRIIEKPLKPALPARPERDPVKLPPPIAAEWDIAETIRDLGGWYELDGEGHVVSINMVYDDRNGTRYDNRYSASDEAMRIAPAFSRLKKLLLKDAQATDESMACLAEMEGLEKFYVWDAKAVTDVGAVHLVHLKNLKIVHLGNGGIGDGALEALSKLENVTTMFLQSNSFTEAGLAHLSKAQQLRSLWIGMSKIPITDAGAEQISKLGQLEQLDLQHNAITDEGLEHLKSLENLSKLYLGTSKATAQGLDALREALPNLQINN